MLEKVLVLAFLIICSRITDILTTFRCAKKCSFFVFLLTDLLFIRSFLPPNRAPGEGEAGDSIKPANPSDCILLWQSHLENPFSWFSQECFTFPPHKPFLEEESLLFSNGVCVSVEDCKTLETLELDWTLPPSLPVSH